MLYTVKEVSELSGVTVKTLHHYHRVGLLLPADITEAGYRMYGRRELERLQEILFYRELDLPLKDIRRLLENEPERAALLSGQRELLLNRKRRLDKVIAALESSLASERGDQAVEETELFRGFQTEEEWREALQEHNEHLKQEYGYDMLEKNAVVAAEMNEQSREAIRYMQDMARLLREGVSCRDERVGLRIREHLEFLRKHGHAFSPSVYAAQSRFLLGDDFHRSMLESQQVGLAYFLCAAADALADRGVKKES